MPKVRTFKTSKPPKGFDQIEPVLQQLLKQMKDAQNVVMDAQRKQQTYWRIWQLHHQISRYIYSLFYEKKEISRELYDYLLNEKYGDRGLIAKWKKQGYEKLCCLNCMKTNQTNYKTTCICRVPKVDLKDEQMILCKNCGCRGCASTD